MRVSNALSQLPRQLGQGVAQTPAKVCDLIAVHPIGVQPTTPISASQSVDTLSARMNSLICAVRTEATQVVSRIKLRKSCFSAEMHYKHPWLDNVKEVTEAEILLLAQDAALDDVVSPKANAEVVSAERKASRRRLVCRRLITFPTEDSLSSPLIPSTPRHQPRPKLQRPSEKPIPSIVFSPPAKELELSDEI